MTRIATPSERRRPRWSAGGPAGFLDLGFSVLDFAAFFKALSLRQKGT